MVLVTQKPHVVCVPIPTQSHIKAMLKLAKILYYRGFRITFVNTDYNHKRFLKSSGPDSLAGLPDFKFESIYDGIDQESNTDLTQDVVALCVLIRDTMFNPLLKLVERISPVTCILCDGFIPCPTAVGEKLGIPVVLSWSVAASEVCEVREKGFKPYTETLTNVSGGIITDPNDTVLNCVIECAKNTAKCSAMIIQTFEELETDRVNHISSIVPNVYAIGPLEPLLAKLPKEEHLDSIGYSLWKEEPECLKWLDSRKENSVLYVNFGSSAIMPPKKIMQFARGLANSKKDFLWIIRTDMIVGENAVLLTKFWEETKDRGFTATWCPQDDVLKHPSICGFLTHCGWNSTIESISAGVPMICLPFFGDQPSNCKLVCNDWDVGMEMDGDLKSDDVERVVREFMDGDKGKQLKKNASEWKEKSCKATSKGGSSCVNLDKLAEKIVQFTITSHSPLF